MSRKQISFVLLFGHSAFAKNGLFLLMLCVPVFRTVHAQSAFVFNPDTSRYIFLPDSSSVVLSNSVASNPDRFRSPIRIGSQQEFDSVFDPAVKAKISPVDFTHYDLLPVSYCSKCITLCDDAIKPCHADRCNYTEHWAVRKKAGKEISSFPFAGPDCIHAVGLEKRAVITSDSLYRAAMSRCPGNEKAEAPDFSKYVLLVSWEKHDCHALIFQKTVEDADSKKITWQISSQYGGCRSMTSTVLWLLVPKKEGYSYVIE